MDDDKFRAAIGLLEEFELNDALLPVAAERLLVTFLNACGHIVSGSGFVESETGVDCYFETIISGRLQRIGVEIKTRNNPITLQTVEQAVTMLETAPYDRMMVVSRSGFTTQAVRLAESIWLGKVDLFGVSELRNWLAKMNPAPAHFGTVAVVVQEFMLKLAEVIAKSPCTLMETEWRDVERLIGAALNELGYKAIVTPSAKDGGFDIDLNVPRPDGSVDNYLIEVKHWLSKQAGTKELKKLVKVAGERRATGSILLATAGFRDAVYEGITEFSTPVRLGTSEKIVSICKAYQRLKSGLWMPGTDLEGFLFEQTVPLGDKFTG